MTDFIDALQSGNPVLMDGALGTELERRGAPIDGKAWSAVMSTHGNLVVDTHFDYINAGANLHIANSFSLARHVLEPVGMGNQFEHLNKLSVSLFNDAVEKSGYSRDDFWLAGSLSTFMAGSDRSLLPVGLELEQNCRDQAEVLVDSGVDFFALEMLFDIDTSKSMLDAISDFGRPVIVGLACEWKDISKSQVTTLGGMNTPKMKLGKVLEGLTGNVNKSNTIFAIMHSDLDVTDTALEVLQSHWNGPVAIYPNSGTFHNLGLDFDSVCSPEEFTAAALRWISKGVNIVGGCCGIGPDHISSLSDKTKESP